jgi:hypothetical protein
MSQGAPKSSSVKISASIWGYLYFKRAKSQNLRAFGEIFGFIVAQILAVIFY